ncbi:hypothetical protein M514_03740 [Trichuris suis]|uniref:Uncharacterized protein n=1 Tax=Trichuris suis TaxID=68888 RepID=A0A085NGY0_9BILA|nr:hypothetical protein M514_03740 [Trichuris suis]
MPTKDAAKAILRHLVFILFLDIVAFSSILPLFPTIIDYYGSNSVKGDLYGLLERLLNRYARFIGIPKEERLTSVAFGGRHARLSILHTAISLHPMVWRHVGFPWKKAHATAQRVGPSVGAYIAYSIRNLSGFWSITAPACFSLLITVAQFCWIHWFLPETLPKSARAKKQKPLTSQVYESVSPKALFLFQALAKREGSRELVTIRRLGLVYFLYLFAYSGLEFTMTFLTHQRFGFNSVQQGKMFLFIGFLMILIQGT